MSFWSDLSFTNLYQSESTLTGGRWKWGGHEGWESEDVPCTVYSLGLPVATNQCALAGGPPDTDAITLAPPTDEPVWGQVGLSFVGLGFDGGVDPADPCYDEGEHTIGLLSGGCRPTPVVSPETQIHTDMAGSPDWITQDGTEDEIKFDGIFLPGDEGGDFYAINPSPITYPGMDPDNRANETLFLVEDLPTLLYYSFPNEAGDARVATAQGNTLNFFIRYFIPIVDTDEPLGTINAGPPIGGVIRRAVKT